MSWIDTIKDTEFSIKTGDGKVFKPILTPTNTKSIEFNGTEYNYINRQGSYFGRRFPKGQKIPLEFSFSGANHIDDYNLFEFSAKDSRAWQIIHPFFGTLTVQPLDLSVNQSGLSLSTVSCNVIETNLANPLKPTATAKETINELNTNFVNANAKLTVSLTGDNKTDLESKVNKASKASEKIAKAQRILTDIKTSTKKAINAVYNSIALTETAIRYATNIITLPAIELSNLTNRLDSLFNTFDNFLNAVKGVETKSSYDKVVNEMLLTSYIANMVLASTINETESEQTFYTRKQVAEIRTQILNKFEAYTEFIYSVEDENYKPSHDVMFALTELVNVGMFYFNDIIFEAKQEREYICKSNTNIIILAHKLYGKASDENINLIKETNKIGISELITIKQGRKIVYFV